MLAVLTGKDVVGEGFATLPPIQPPPGRGGMALLWIDRPILARDRVRFAGEEIAVVVAETQRRRAHAADLIEVEFEDLPVLIGPLKAMAPGAFQMHDKIPGNLCFDFEYGNEKAVADAFARAAGWVTLTAESPRVAPNPMEVRSALAAYDETKDVYTFYSPNQGGPAFCHELSIISGIPHEKIRVPMIDVGGAFGARTAPFSEYPVLMVLAKRLKRPVKWSSTRSEDFLTDNHGRAVSLKGELAYDANGKFLAIRTEWVCRLRRLFVARRCFYQLDQRLCHRRRRL